MKRLNTYLHKITMKFIDIGANLTDPMYNGNYHGSQKHEPDLKYVLDRSWKEGLEKIIITVGTVNECENAYKIAQLDERLYITMGCHPTRCSEFEPNPEDYFFKICNQIETYRDKVIAIGEFGLDYDRLQFCDKETQLKYFDKQFDLVEKYNLPLFLHCRNAHDDFIKILQKNLPRIKRGGVVHSFDGTLDEANKLVELGFFIGLNGCSLKSAENLSVVSKLPANKIMIETDAPWCGVRATHAGSKFIKTKFPTVKKKEKWTKDTLIDGRNEPAQIIQVLEIIAGCRDDDVEKLGQQFYENTKSLFFTKK